jgi:hypothetical protein
MARARGSGRDRQAHGATVKRRDGTVAYRCVFEIGWRAALRLSQRGVFREGAPQSIVGG